MKFKSYSVKYWFNTWHQIASKLQRVAVGCQVQTDTAGGQEGEDDGEGASPRPRRHLIYTEGTVEIEKYPSIKTPYLCILYKDNTLMYLCILYKDNTLMSF